VCTFEGIRTRAQSSNPELAAPISFRPPYSCDGTWPSHFDDSALYGRTTGIDHASFKSSSRDHPLVTVDDVLGRRSSEALELAIPKKTLSENYTRQKCRKPRRWEDL